MKKNFFFGGRREGGECRISTEKKKKTKNNRYSLIFCKGHNSANVLRNSVKSYLNTDPKQSSELQDPSSSNSLHIALTRFFYCFKR